jgi:penicillin-binding protein 2
MKRPYRIAAVAGLFALLFGFLGIRLWFLQVGEGGAAAAVIEEEGLVSITTPSPRGDIRDRNGQLLVTSRIVPMVVMDRQLLQSSQKEEAIARLAAKLDIPSDWITTLYEEAGVNQRFPLAVVDSLTAYQLQEQLRSFPGVVVENYPERVYLTGGVLSHVIGHLGFPSGEDLQQRPYLDPNTRIGKLGVEGFYDEWLQGTTGERVYRVNKAGQITEERAEVPPVSGATVYLTVDERLQRVVEEALLEGIALSNLIKDEEREQPRVEDEKSPALSPTERATAVVMDITNGEILALASYPDFDPQQFVWGIDQFEFARLSDQKAFLNLAVGGLYPPASTFKAVTYTAALLNNIPFAAAIEGVDSANRKINCDGELVLTEIDEGSPQVFRDWYYPRELGWLDIHSAFEHSCNIFFYNLALGVWRNWRNTPREDVLQEMARSIGYGSFSGVDLSGDQAGIVPDRELFESWKTTQLEDPSGPIRLDPARLALASPWVGGDLMNLAIGQGDMLASPLQVAVSYGALANGGTVWIPRVVSQVRSAEGELLWAAIPESKNEVSIPPSVVSSLLSDMNRVVVSGTARRAFSGFGPSLNLVGGKTGTGQSSANRDSHAWFVGVAPINNPKWVVAVLVDEGGSGGRVAAPMGRYIMQHLMGEELDPIEAGEATD